MPKSKNINIIQQAIADATSNYETRIQALQATSTQQPTRTPMYIPTKNGGCYTAEHNSEIVFIKEIVVDRSNLYAIETEIQALKAMGYYKGHQVINLRQGLAIKISQESFDVDLNWFHLNHKRLNQQEQELREIFESEGAPRKQAQNIFKTISENFAKRPSNLQQLVSSSIVGIADKISKDLQQLYLAGFFHNDINNSGNIIVKTNREKNAIIDAKLIDFDAASRLKELKGTSKEGLIESIAIPPKLAQVTNASSKEIYTQELGVCIHSIKKTNKIREAWHLFSFLKNQILNTDPPQTIQNKTNSIKNIILKNYLIPKITTTPSAKTTKFINTILQQDRAHQSNPKDQNTIQIIDHVNEITEIQNKIRERYFLTTELEKNDAWQHNITEQIKNKKHIIISPHLNNLGVKSKSRVDITIISPNGNITDQFTFVPKDQKRYLSKTFGRLNQINQENTSLKQIIASPNTSAATRASKLKQTEKTKIINQRNNVVNRKNNTPRKGR